MPGFVAGACEMCVACETCVHLMLFFVLQNLNEKNSNNIDMHSINFCCGRAFM